VKLYSLITIFLQLAPLRLMAQEELPFNFNKAFFGSQREYKIIKETCRYDEGDYKAERIHYFDEQGLNYRTVSTYKDEKQGFIKLFYNEKQQLISFIDYGRWISKSDVDYSYYDSTFINRKNEYYYNAHGKIERCTSVWNDQNQKPGYRYEIGFKYDSLSRKLVEEETYYNLKDEYFIYFEPKSAKISPDQTHSKVITYKKVYRYKGDSTIIKNYINKVHKSQQIIVKKGNQATEILKSPKGEILKTTVYIYNDQNKIITKIDTGDVEITPFGEYGDEISYDRREYNYDSSGYLKREVYISSKYNSRQYIDYDYIK
jgi:hypothetical protein